MYQYIFILLQIILTNVITLYDLLLTVWMWATSCADW